ncbi:MAG: S41 family peptidase [Candidatus Omnitrophota bacterium]
MRKGAAVVIISALIIFGIYSIVSSAAEQNKAGKNKKDDLYRQVELFSDTLAIIDSEYVDETKPRDLIYGALKGMLSALDPHSQFMDPDTYNELKVDTEGKFGGLGIEITIEDGLLTVVTPIEGTPAWKVGLKPKDKIVKINGEITRDMTLTEAVKRLRGNPGEAVNISILRESEKKILDFKIVRDIIKVNKIKEAKILQDNIGYIRLAEFGENTAKDMDIALESLKKEGMNALILDLRNNPGGLLDAAVRITGKFLEKGKLIVYTKGRKQNQNMEFFSKEAHPITDMPMVVLINEGSASGSEIMAGSFQDHKRAIILGIKSFGKGSVQTIVPLSDGSALRLTTSRYFTPSGKLIHEKGIMPDIVVEEGRIELAGEPEPKIQKPEEIFEQIEKKEKPEKKEELKEYSSDSQLMRAVDILKAIRIYREDKK